ncbi:glycosyltransferase family 2 protein [Galbibacter sp. EGI 63066]|uniref:cellulose synthase family protein n=1 Tax=Galbibacter sp. EGI 63066 TaxID=2993559 RepID=UPI0022494C8B|nr:cellulose synthase family protein [Galbibacter sp. EGI 63066]MCX2679923.1 glycosyltransferase family 2 protein [Galbibacter sp. EGI 63066]
MIEIVSYSILGIYIFALVFILIYSLTQLNLLVNYLHFKKNESPAPKFNSLNASEIPNITVQLPVYNEDYVIERLLDNIVKLEYPSQKLEIQVLDDSTEESVEKTIKKIEALQQLGFDIKHIRRNNREGFKAGALKEGLKAAKGDFIAIFDADFLPEKDWLKKTVPYFKDPEIGVVQTRWGHLNRNYSLLTEIQAFALDAHFTIEQVGRNAKGHFINFNGTAGIWRKECIVDAGNWEADTLTEDLDLSYRAQLKNWKFKYLEDVETPAELPVVISAARTQQFRWNKGGAENFRKTVSKLLKADKLPLKTKIHGFIHLLNSSMFLCAFLIAFLSVPVLFIRQLDFIPAWIFDFTGIFIASTLILYICYWFTYKNLKNEGWTGIFSYTRVFIAFFTIVLGFTLHNSVAVIQGHLGKRSGFVRTPKFNIKNISDSWKSNKYLSNGISKSLIPEGILLLYFLFGMFSAFHFNDFSFFPFHLILCLGFGFVFFHSITSRTSYA